MKDQNYHESSKELVNLENPTRVQNLTVQEFFQDQM
jgi:hypothetical protein